jgi:hypothetical protein
VNASCVSPWPLTVEEGLLTRSATSAITFWPSEGDETIYQVNGRAASEGFQDLEEIWSDKPGSDFKVSVSGLLKAGRSLCN